MPFRVSIGDVIACAGLVKNVVIGLEKGGGSSAIYQQLITKLYIPERALLLVKRLSLDETLEAEPLVALAVAKC